LAREPFGLPTPRLSEGGREAAVDSSPHVILLSRWRDPCVRAARRPSPYLFVFRPWPLVALVVSTGAVGVFEVVVVAAVAIVAAVALCWIAVDVAVRRARRDRVRRGGGMGSGGV
jgi:hypothetical protein